MSSSRLLAVPVGLLLTAGLVACSGGSPSADDSPASTTLQNEQAPSPAPTVEALSAQNVIARLTAAQAAVTSYSMAVSVTGATPMELSGWVDLAAGKRNAVMMMTDPDLGVLELRFVDGVLFLKLGDLTGGLYLQLDPNDPSNELAASFAGFGDLLVESGFEGTEAAVVSVTPVGAPEMLDDVEVQAYDVVLDTTKLTSDAADDLLEEGMAALPPTVTYRYWIDGDDIPRKTVTELNGSVTTLTVTKLGAGLPVVAPPADQVTTELPF